MVVVVVVMVMAAAVVVVHRTRPPGECDCNPPPPPPRQAHARNRVLRKFIAAMRPPVAAPFAGNAVADITMRLRSALLAGGGGGYAGASGGDLQDLAVLCEGCNKPLARASCELGFACVL